MNALLTESVTNKISLTKEEIIFYKEEGYLVIPQLLKQEAINEIKGDIVKAVSLACGSKQSKLAQTNQYLENSFLDAMVNSSDIAAIVNTLLGGKSSLYMPFTAIKSANGGGEFHFHQDNQYTCLDGPALNVWVALTDMTPENGCLCVCPKSHQGNTLDAVESPDKDGHLTVNYHVEKYLPVRMTAGSCIIFDRLLVHGSSFNQTNENRVAYAIQWHRNDVKAKGRGETEFTLVTENPRYHTKPVKAFMPQAEFKEYH